MKLINRKRGSAILIILVLGFQIAYCTPVRMIEEEVNPKKENSKLAALVLIATLKYAGSGLLSNSTSAPSVSVAMPTSIYAYQTCGLICGYQMDYAFSIRNNLSETITVSKIYQEYLATQQDTSPICSSTWENGIIGKDTCGLISIAANGVGISSALAVSSGTSIPLSINNAGYTNIVGYIRITITYSKSTGSSETASGISSIR